MQGSVSRGIIWGSRDIIRVICDTNLVRSTVAYASSQEEVTSLLKHGHAPVPYAKIGARQQQVWSWRKELGAAVSGTGPSTVFYVSQLLSSPVVCDIEL